MIAWQAVFSEDFKGTRLKFTLISDKMPFLRATSFRACLEAILWAKFLSSKAASKQAFKATFFA